MSELDDLRKIIMVTSLYMTVTGKPPDSTKTIENFCSDYNLPNCGIDLKKFEIQRLENGKVNIKYKSDILSTTMEIEKISQSPAEANSPAKKDIEELLKELTK
ncbi:MAG: hypothetical protein ABSG97_10260 [Sedimentisphaerales bacterium]